MDAVAPASNTIDIFCSYSRKDEAFCEELEKHLSILQSNGTISSWYDRAIPTGKDWQGQIDEHLNSAHVILLLISPDFLASKYIREVELRRALERHNAGEAVVISIILRDVDWQGSPLSKLQALPKDALPVTSWPNQDQAFKDIAVGIRKVAERLRRSHVATDPVLPSSEITSDDAQGKRHQDNSRHAINRSAMRAIGGIVAVGLLASLAYLAFQRAKQKSQEQMAKIQAVPDWSVVNIDFPLLGDCRNFDLCKARREQADRLRAVPDWQHIRFDYGLLGDCMKYQPCVARREQADKLQAVPPTGWAHIRFDDGLLSDCMEYQPCVARREQADKLRAVADWQGTPKSFPLLDDCMAFQPCVARRELAKQQNQDGSSQGGKTSEGGGETLDRHRKRFP